MLSFWVLDIATEVEDGPVAWIWSIGEDGSRLIVKEPFRPVFYLTGGDLEGISTCLEASKDFPISSFSLVERRLSGRPLRAVMVSAMTDELEGLAERLRRKCGAEGVFEADIRASSQFLMRRRIRPSSWHAVEASESEAIGGYKVYRASGDYQRLERVGTPDLKVLAFDSLLLASRGTPKPEVDPAIAISAVTDRGEERQFSGDEAGLLRGFIGLVEGYDPDVVVGFNTNRRLLPYLAERCRRLGFSLSIGRLGAEPRTSVYGHQSLQGRLNIDLYDLAEETPEIKLETLEEYSSYLGLKVEYDTIDEYDLAEAWGKERSRVLEYSMQRARGIMEVYKAVSDYIFSLSEITGLPADHVLTAATGFRVENYLMGLAMEAGELVPPRGEAAYMTYAGGVVMEPRAGLHEDVAVIDFKSMYPNIMMKYNISFDTLSVDGVHRAPNLPHAFKEEVGFIPRALKGLLEERERARRLADMHPEGSVERRVLEARQRALKVIANATYGYMGWTGARWYCREAAEATSAWGRETIRSAMERAKGLGLEIIYGDTDSLFVRDDPERIRSLLGWISEALGMEARVDRRYRKVLFTEAKKRYGGLRDDGRIETVGLEVVRGDWSAIAKEAQLAALEAILKEGREEAVERVRETIEALREGRVPIKKLIIWKKLTKGVEEYEVAAPHVTVAKRMIEAGWSVKPGDMVGFIIMRGRGRLYEKAVPYFEADPSRVDVDYYIEKQVIPPVARLLSAIGIPERTLGELVLKK
ncbi:DNA polymerase II [Candidatus Bathyarchaeota archaeon]|nr:DNA polymerase II [Candidatus Bathyarchaeota archaeon]